MSLYTGKRHSHIGKASGTCLAAMAMRWDDAVDCAPLHLSGAETMNRSKLIMPVLSLAVIAALAGCNKPAADPPMQPSTPSTGTAPMSPASAASQ
jgi:hypothetical protein